MDKYILDDENRPHRVNTLSEYYAWKNAQPKERQTGSGLRLAKDERGEVCVSTVYIGSDHGWGEPLPVLWESMVFGGEHNGECHRYTSHEDAMRGHEIMCLIFLPVKADA